MDWSKLKSAVSAPIKKAEKAAVDTAKTVAKDVEHAAAREADKVVGWRPVQALIPRQADRADAFLNAHSGFDFPRTVSAGAPKTHAALAPGVPANVVPKGGFHLTAKNPTATFGVHLDAAGPARLDLNAAGPGTDWAKKGAESAVVSVYVDGKYQQDAVLSGGGKNTPYSLSLGSLPKGDHAITLRFAKEKSSPGAKGIDVASGTASAVSYPNKEAQWAAENAPVLIGRHGGLENNHDDTPLAMFHHVNKNPDGTTTLSYGYVFSNEDTGDGGQPGLEQARWGRLTDLETVFKVTVDANGKVLDRQYEGAGHHWHPFNGKFDGTNPIIRTATDNNNVTDQGDGPLKFRFPTDYRVGDFPTEELMHRNPEWFAVQGKELLREGKIDREGIGDAAETGLRGQIETLFEQRKMADPRNYLYVQIKAEGAATAPITARVTLKNGKSFDSNLGVADASIARDCWAQTTVRLPPGTTQADIASVKFVSGGDGKSHVDRLGSVFLLDPQYKPIDLPKSVVKL